MDSALRYLTMQCHAKIICYLQKTCICILKFCKFDFFILLRRKVGVRLTESLFVHLLAIFRFNDVQFSILI